LHLSRRGPLAQLVEHLTFNQLELNVKI